MISSGNATTLLDRVSAEPLALSDEKFVEGHQLFADARHGTEDFGSYAISIRADCGRRPTGPATAAMRWITAGRGWTTSPCSNARTVRAAKASRSSPGRSRKSGLRGR